MMASTEHLQVSIVAFEERYARAFAELNYEWLRKYFVIEPIDRKILEHPHEYIMEPGGEILMAIVDGAPVGTVALIKTGPQEYELAKMAVTEQYKGLRIGQKLMYACIDTARQLGCNRLWLDSNSSLTPALSLYTKVGFKHIERPKSKYARGDVRMELFL